MHGYRSTGYKALYTIAIRSTHIFCGEPPLGVHIVNAGRERGPRRCGEGPQVYRDAREGQDGQNCYQHDGI